MTTITEKPRGITERVEEIDNLLKYCESEQAIKLLGLIKTRCWAEDELDVILNAVKKYHRYYRTQNDQPVVKEEEEDTSELQAEVSDLEDKISELEDEIEEARRDLRIAHAEIQRLKEVRS